MKKFFTIFLNLLFLLNSNFDLAQSLVYADQKSESKATPAKISKDNQFVVDIEITKEPVNLKSYLNRGNSAYLYSITNLENAPIKITEIKGWAHPWKSIQYTKYDRKDQRFPRVLLPPAEALMVIVLLPIDWPFLHMMFVYDDPHSRFNFLEMSNEIFIRPIKNTVFAPYYCIKDHLEDKKALKEEAMFNYNNFTTITIKPKEKVQFAVFFNTSNPTKINNSEISMTIINMQTEQKCIIEK
jgi:hypothetical protein